MRPSAGGGSTYCECFAFSYYRAMAVAELFRIYNQGVVRQAAKLLGCSDRAQDVAQEAFAGLLARMANAAVPEPRAYLFTAARNLALDKLRRERTEAQAGPAAMAGLADVAPSAEAVVASRQRLVTLAMALNELPDATRTVFLLARVEGLPHREIAARLGVSVSMVEKHVARALVHTRERLLPDL